MAKEAQAFTAGPKGRKPTKEEARAMAAALFDSITRQQAQKARTQEKS